MALVSPGIQISINDQSQYVGSNVGSVPLVVLATAQDKTYNGAAAVGTSKANAGKLLSFTSQRDLVTAMGTPNFQLSSAGTPVNASEINEYGLLAAYSALGLGNRLFAIRADVDLNQLTGTSVRPVGEVADGTYWLDLANTEIGLYELNASTKAFQHINPLLITDATQVDFSGDYAYEVPVPSTSVGQQGSYALVFVDPNNATPDVIRLFYKSDVTAADDVGANQWVEVGSLAWQNSIVTAQGTVTSATIPTSSTLTINTLTVSLPSTGTLGIADVATAITAYGIPGVTAKVLADGTLAIHATDEARSDGATLDGKIIITDGTSTPLARCGFTLSGGTATFNAPYFYYGDYASAPAGGWFSTDTRPRPTGSIWWKTSSTGTGYSPALKKYSTSLGRWISVIAPLSATLSDAIASLDSVGGGINIAQGQIITQIGSRDTTSNNFRFYEQVKSGTMVATGTTAGALTPGDSFIVESSVPGSNNTITTTITLSGGTTDYIGFVRDVLTANIPYVSAEANANGTISLIHTAGGYIILTDSNGSPVADAGFVDGVSPYIQVLSNQALQPVVLTNFKPITMDVTYGASTPYAAPSDGSLWYYSNPAEVDIMINNNGWKGYRTVSSDVRGYTLTSTDANGVIASASRPTSQSGGGALVSGDLWLDSSDTINYPALYRYNGTSFVAIDNTDHISNNGIIFADARWDTNGTIDPISDSLPAITTLLSSNYIDQDAPDHRLYPRGTLLFNTRRSGYNVKKFVSNYYNSTSFPNPGSIPNTAGTLPDIADAWVSDSGLKENGSMYAGSAAQRAIVVAALKSAVDSNTDVLDANYQYNLLVAPGYPELIPNLVTLNDNRSSTGFVIGDTPMTLAPSATDITAWNSNRDGGGLATSSPYLGIYYPSGLTNDLAGNAVAVPASHAVLRTFLYNDNVSYQWFAPAGIHRGLVGNFSDIGYVNAQTGAFIHNGVNQGLRDTLYTLSINPITQLPGTGIVVWGQETRSGDTTARNRVNVVRLENYLRTIFNSIANGFLFEPNDTITRKSIATQIESALHNLLSKRGLYDFLVICDTSNNTPSTIANNQLYVDVAVEPMRDVEFIYIPIALYNPGTVATLGAAST
jgi:hypothetical protein